MDHCNKWDMARVTFLTACLVLCIIPTEVQAYNDTIGPFFDPATGAHAMERNAFGVFLLIDTVFDDSVVYSMSTVCVKRNRPVWFQVWRPSSGKYNYTLVGQTKVNCLARRLPARHVKNLHALDECIVTKKGDIGGVYHPTDQSPIAYQFQSTLNRVLRSDCSSVDLGSWCVFPFVEFPYRLSVGFTFDTDMDKCSRPGTLPPMSSTTQIPTVPPIPPVEDSTRYVGNSLIGMENVMGPRSPMVYLLPHLRFGRGVITQFYAYFVRLTPIWLQVWRLVKVDETTGISTYMLVDQVRTVPQFFDWRVQVDLDINSYIFTEEGDVMGLYVETDINPLGYSLLSENHAIEPMATTLEGVPYPGFNLTFTKQTLPYNFPVGATYDTDRNTSVYGTPRPIVVTIPPTTTITSTTLSPPTTLPEFVKEPSVGRNTIRDTDKSLAGRRTYILRDHTFPENGKIKALYACVVKNGWANLQVWRNTSTGSENNFTLVGSKTYRSNTIGCTTINLRAAEQFQVQRGDMLGFYNEDELFSVIGYHFTPARLLYNSTDSDQYIGRSMLFEHMELPYEFAIAATYETEVIIPRPGKPKAVVSAEDENLGWLTQPKILLIMFTWLCVLTVLFVVLCTVMLLRTKPKKKKVPTATLR